LKNLCQEEEVEVPIQKEDRDQGIIIETKLNLEKKHSKAREIKHLVDDDFYINFG
jgi:hypothetical protein